MPTASRLQEPNIVVKFFSYYSSLLRLENKLSKVLRIKVTFSLNKKSEKMDTSIFSLFNIYNMVLCLPYFDSTTITHPHYIAKPHL